MIHQTLKMSLSAILSNKLRTFLTMLGVIIGVASLIVLVSLAGGATSSVSNRISAMGSNYLTVRILDDKENPLRLGEMKEMWADEAIGTYAPYARTSLTGKSSTAEGNIILYGTTPAYAEIMEQEMAYGRYLKTTDVDNTSAVIVLTQDTAVEYFGRNDAVGETIKLSGKTFQVVGVLARDESLTSTANSAESETSVRLEGYIPFTTLCRTTENGMNITTLYLNAGEDYTLDEAEEVTEQILLARLGYDEDAYSLQNQSEIQEAMEEVTNTLSLMIGGIAAISLLVGGIGIMNIMLVSVTERTREIGIRKAIGASNFWILFQFLLEAIIVSLAGCLAGVGLAWCILKVLGVVMSGTMNLSMDMDVVKISILFSSIIGVVFGFYPAARAAAKKPIDALRYGG